MGTVPNPNPPGGPPPPGRPPINQPVPCAEAPADPPTVSDDPIVAQKQATYGERARFAPGTSSLNCAS